MPMHVRSELSLKKFKMGVKSWLKEVGDVGMDSDPDPDGGM